MPFRGLLVNLEDVWETFDSALEAPLPRKLTEDDILRSFDLLSPVSAYRLPWIESISAN